MLTILNLDQVHLASWTLLGTRMEQFWWEKFGGTNVGNLQWNVWWETWYLKFSVEEFWWEKWRRGGAGGIKREVGISSKRREKKFREKEEKIMIVNCKVTKRPVPSGSDNTHYIL